MRLESPAGVQGTLNIVVTNAQGEVTQDVTVKNLVVDTGLNLLVSRITNSTGAVLSHMSIGTGTNAAAANNTTLQTELAGARVAFTSAVVTGASVVYSAAFGAGVGTGAITEAGLFNAASAGTMFSRTVFPVVNKQAEDSMTITWTIQSANA